MSRSRTLIVAPNWVGDVVMALPTLEILARERRLAILGRPHLEALVEASRLDAEFVVRERRNRDTVERLRGLEAEEAIILPNSFRSAWLPYRARIPIRWGYSGDFRRPLLEPPVSPPTGRGRHQLRDYDRLLKALGLKPEPHRLPRLEPGAAARKKAEETLAALAAEGGSAPRVGLFAGTAFGPSKRWPAERFGDLARLLSEDEGEPVALFAGPGEVELARRVAAASGVPCPVVGSDLDLGELAALLAGFDTLITNDSGPMHLAAAVGVRCVAIFGPTDPRRTAPLGEGHRVLWTHRWCSPCFRKRCPLFHHRCMGDIGVDQVLEAWRQARAQDSME